MPKPRQRFFIDRQIGIVDGDGHGAVGKRFAGPKACHNILERQNSIGAAGKHFEMLLELRDGDIGAWIVGFAKPVIHQDSGVIGRACRIHRDPGKARENNQGE